jgi:hypothetical protein
MTPIKLAKTDSADSTVQTREQADDKNGSDSGNDNDKKA